MMSGGREGRGGRVGQKVLSKPSADSFAVGRRQKEKNIGQMGSTILFCFTIGTGGDAHRPAMDIRATTA
jgi:hypothetical protein